MESLFGLTLLAVFVLTYGDGPERVHGAYIRSRAMTHIVFVCLAAHLRTAQGDAALGEFETAIAYELGSVQLLAGLSRRVVLEGNALSDGIACCSLSDLATADEVPALSGLLLG